MNTVYVKHSLWTIPLILSVTPHLPPKYNPLLYKPCHQDFPQDSSQSVVNHQFWNSRRVYTSSLAVVVDFSDEAPTTQILITHFYTYTSPIKL